MRRIRAEVAATWDRVDGYSKLLQLAEDDFPEYLRIVVKLMPRETRLSLARPFVERRPELRGEQATRFVDALEALANGGRVTPAMVLDTLRECARDAS